MSPRADVSEFLGRRREKIRAALHAWTETAQSNESVFSLSAVVEAYLSGTNLGDVATVGSSSIYLERKRASNAPTVLVLGSHDASQLIPADPAATLALARETSMGPGVGSLFGSTCAFVEGAKAALEATMDEPVNLKVLSVGPTDRPEACLAEVGMDNIDAIFVTNSVAWDISHPTITTGSRGRLLLEIAVDGSHALNDEVFAGAVRNPLGRLTTLIGSLRDDRGRITIPGFYDRAIMATEADRSAFREGGYDPNDWLGGMTLSRPAGSLSALERATLWPVVSVLDVSPSDHNVLTTAANAKATLAFYLIPDQRPVHVEAAVRTWVTEQLPDNLPSSVSVISMARPYRCDPSTPALSAQIAAVRGLGGKAPTLIPGGGAAGAGEITYLTGAPVAFAGLIGPVQGWGTAAETLPWPVFDHGVKIAADTCTQLGSQRRSRSS